MIHDGCEIRKATVSCAFLEISLRNIFLEIFLEIVLCNVFTPTRKALDFKHASQ